MLENIAIVLATFMIPTAPLNTALPDNYSFIKKLDSDENVPVIKPFKFNVLSKI